MKDAKTTPFMQRTITLVSFSLVLIFLGACNKERNNQREIINGMEQVIKKNPTDEFIRPLLANYFSYCEDFREDEFAPIYLYRSAVLYFRIGNYSEAIINLERILRDYPNTEIKEDVLLTLAMINARSGSTPRASELFKQYLEQYPKGKGVARAEYFFAPAESKLQDRIDAIQQEINALPRSEFPSSGKLTELMFAYAHFVKANPTAPLSPSYCLQGAQLAIRLDHHLMAVQFLDKIYREYPSFSQYPQALLMLAVEYDTNLTLYLRKGKVVSGPLDSVVTESSLATMDLVAKGGEFYKEIIKRYPNHEVTPSAQSGLKNLGKKTNQVVEEFIKAQDSINAIK